MVALLLLEAPADCWQRDDDNYDSGASGDGSVGSDDESFIAGSRDSEQSDEEEDDDGEEDKWKDGEEDEDENKKALCMYALLSDARLGGFFVLIMLADIVMQMKTTTRHRNMRTR